MRETCLSHVISVFYDDTRDEGRVFILCEQTRTWRNSRPDDLPARCSVFSVCEWECSKDPALPWPSIVRQGHIRTHQIQPRSTHSSKLNSACEKVRKYVVSLPILGAKNQRCGLLPLIDSSAFAELALYDGRSLACNWKSSWSLVLYRLYNLWYRRI